MSEPTWEERLETAITDFKTAIYGESVRDSMVDIAEVIKEIVSTYATTVTDDFDEDDPNAAAQMQAIANILFGGSDHTGKVPLVENHYTPVIPEGQTFDVRTMPVGSSIWLSASVLTGIPNYVGDHYVFIMRKPITANGYTSIFLCYEATVMELSYGTSVNNGNISWKKINNVNKTASELINSDALNNNWVISNWTAADKWYALDGTLVNNETNTLKHSQMIPVYPEQVLYSSWFGSNPVQRSAGAFFDKDKNWIAPIGMPSKPYPESETTYDPINVEEYSYPHADVTPDKATALAYVKMWKITVPENAYYVSLNLCMHSANLKNVQSLSTLPILRATNTGNIIWRNDDKDFAKKKDKKLYVIGPSYASIDRAVMNVYDAATGGDPVAQPIVGFQEHLIPYYRQVITLGFDGIGYQYNASSGLKSAYMSLTGDTDSSPSSYYNTPKWYVGHSTNNLSDADEVIIMANGNEVNYGNIGEPDSRDRSSYCGSINLLIDYIYQINDVNDDHHHRHPVRIYLQSRPERPRSTGEPTNIDTEINYCMRQIASLRNLCYIDCENIGMNKDNYKYYTYDSNRDIYEDFGGHPNNAGNSLFGVRMIESLLNNGDQKGKIVYQTLRNNRDLNSVVESGWYRCLAGRSYMNRPEPKEGTLRVEHYQNGNFATQTFYVEYENGIYARHTNNIYANPIVWSEWKSPLTYANRTVANRTVEGDIIKFPVSDNTVVKGVSVDKTYKRIVFSTGNLKDTRPLQVVGSSSYSEAGLNPMTTDAGLLVDGLTIKYDSANGCIIVNGSINNTNVDTVRIRFWDTQGTFVADSKKLPVDGAWYNFSTGWYGDNYAYSGEPRLRNTDRYQKQGKTYYMRATGSETYSGTLNPIEMENAYVATAEPPTTGFTTLVREINENDALSRKFVAYEDGADFRTAEGYNYSGWLIIHKGFTFNNMKFYPLLTLGTGLKSYNKHSVSAFDVFDQTKSYDVNDYCIYKNILYRCKSAVEAGNIFDSSYWDKGWNIFQMTKFKGNVDYVYAYALDSTFNPCGKITVEYSDSVDNISLAELAEKEESVSETKKTDYYQTHYGSECDTQKERFERVRYYADNYHVLTNFNGTRTDENDYIKYDYSIAGMNRGLRIVAGDGMIISADVTLRESTSVQNYIKTKIYIENANNIEKLSITLTDSDDKNAVFDLTDCMMTSQSFSPSAAYSVGDIVEHNGIQFICINAKSAGAAWSDSDWEWYDKTPVLGTVRRHLSDGINYIIDNLYFSTAVSTTEEDEDIIPVVDFNTSAVQKITFTLKSKTGTKVAAVFGEVITYDTKSMITFKFDDGNYSDWLSARPYFNAKGIPFVSAVARNTARIGDYYTKQGITGTLAAPYNTSGVVYNTGDKATHDGHVYSCNENNVSGAWDSSKWTYMSTESVYLRWYDTAKAKTLISEGHELINHCLTQNRKLSNYTIDEQKEEIRKTRDWLLGIGAGRSAYTAVYTMGTASSNDIVDGHTQTRDDLVDVVMKQSIRIKPVVSGQIMNCIPAMEPTNVHSYSYTNNRFAEEYKMIGSRMKIAAEFGLWFAITMHDIRRAPAGATLADTYGINETLLKELVDLAATLKSESKAEVVTYTGAYDLM